MLKRKSSGLRRYIKYVKLSWVHIMELVEINSLFNQNNFASLRKHNRNLGNNQTIMLEIKNSDELYNTYSERSLMDICREISIAKATSDF